MAKAPEFTEAIRVAEKSLKTPMPPFDADRYLDFTTNGNRTRYQTINSKRWARLKDLVIGECLEGKARFIPAIEETVKSLCGDPSWVLPAHDPDARVFKGGNPFVDLAVAMNGYQMALAAWLLEDRLAPETLALMRENVSKRLTGPVLRTIDGSAPPDVIKSHWWARCNHNWNAVCTTGAVGAILVTETSPEVRAKAIAWAEANMTLFLSGFGKDGYCSEGVGYWSYGFGHFTHLGEIVRSHSNGTVDLFKPAAVRVIAAAPMNLEMADAVYPAFADCGLNAAPDPSLVQLLQWRLDGKPISGSAADPLLGGTLLYMTLAELAVRRETGAIGSSARPPLPLRSWFPHSGVCVVRPSQPGGLAAAWKGGNNAEHHNHNDVGSTVITWQGRPVIADPGAMVYNARTFSKDRYRQPIMGSFGHAVPVVAGSLQVAGAGSTGKVVSTTFTAAADEVVMDLSSAYPGVGLKKLDRTWNYQRAGNGALHIEDRFEFGSPASFSTALMGMGDWFLVNADKTKAAFLIDAGQGATLEVNVTFSASGKWQVQQLPNPGKTAPRRLGLSLEDPAATGWIRMRITPAAAGATKGRDKIPASPVPEMLENARMAPISA